jgi:hypothetical protein
MGLRSPSCVAIRIGRRSTHRRCAQRDIPGPLHGRVARRHPSSARRRVDRADRATAEARKNERAHHRLDRALRQTLCARPRDVRPGSRLGSGGATHRGRGAVGQGEWARADALDCRVSEVRHWSASSIRAGSRSTRSRGGARREGPMEGGPAALEEGGARLMRACGGSRLTQSRAVRLFGEAYARTTARSVSGALLARARGPSREMTRHREGPVRGGSYGGCRSSSRWGSAI